MTNVPLNWGKLGGVLTSNIQLHKSALEKVQQAENQNNSAFAKMVQTSKK